jgi:hypothetical protein
MNKLTIFTVVLILSACSLVSHKSVSTASVAISIEHQDRIRFSGKGAGAGMMMSSSMGAMGIAIGVAIDEGIAKEIHESFVASGGNFSAIIKSETYAWLVKLCGSSEQVLNPLCNATTELKLRVYHYGVVTTSGENDSVEANFEIGIVLNDQEELRLDLKDLDDDQFKAPLDKIKKDGSLASDLLTKSFAVLLQNYEATQKTQKH